MKTANDTSSGKRSVLGVITTFACVLPALAGPTLVLSPDGLTVFDTVNKVNWLADFNLPASNRFGLPVCNASNVSPTDSKGCINASGSMSYQAATAWVDAMNAANYLGHNNWQLPATPLVDNTGCTFVGANNGSFGFECASGALGWLYYNGLGLNAPNSAVPIAPYHIGPFSNFQPYYYWSQTPGDNANNSGYNTFSFNTGFQDTNTKPNYMYVLPMIPGKIPGTPAAIGSQLQTNPGGQTVYDPMTNVTFLANANLAATNTFGIPTCKDHNAPKPCVGADGAMDWDSASQFVANMNAAAYLGQTNWQLPPVDPNCPSYGCGGSINPMGNLYYDQLGLFQGTPVVVAPNFAVGPFNNVQPYIYWSCQAPTIQSPCQPLTNGPATGFEWCFSFGNGFLGTDVFGDDYYVTAYFVGQAATATFFTGEVSLGSGVEYLQFPDSIVFGYYTFVANTIFYHYDMGYEAFVPGSASDVYLYDFTSGHWWYSSSSLFPYLYDFTMKNWIYYFPNTTSPGHYTTNPRYFSNLTTGKIFTM